MNLDHLKYFIDAARNGGVSQAAKKNFVTQSAVSRAIKRLEEELDAELVVHRQNRFQLSEIGEAVFNQSHSIFAAVDELKAMVETFSGVYKGPLRFACNQAIASHLIGPLLPVIAEKHPNIEVTMRLGNTDQVQQMIDQREVDFGIALNDGEIGKKYSIAKIFEDQFIVVKSPDCSFAAGESLIVSRTRKGGMSHKYFAAFKRAYGHQVEPILEIPSWQVVRDLAIAGVGQGLVPNFICSEALRAKQLKVVRHKVKPIHFALCTMVQANRQLPKNAEVLLDELPEA